jgi:hypothetical protein
MTQLELLAMMAAQLASNGRSLQGAVAAARELLDLTRAAEPEAAAAHDRSRMAEAALRRRLAASGPGA